MIIPFDRQRWQAGLGSLLAEWTDDIVPDRVDPLPQGSYSPVYAWMYAYEKRLKRRIERALGRPLEAWERRLFGPDGAFSEGLSNAFLHGHKRDPTLTIRITCRVGREGLSFTVTDQGPGFDAAAVVARAQSGGAYFHVAGNGLKCLARSPDLDAAHADGGRTLHLLIHLKPQPTSAPDSPPQ